MKKNKFGFTLVELLAVVLIIGIMTAIAVPQYRKSIQRAEAMEGLVNLKSIYESAKRYKAAFSEAPTKLLGLDVHFYDATSTTDSTFDLERYRYTFTNSYIKACRIGGNYCFYMYYNHTNGKDYLTCGLTTTGGKYDWICEALGKTASNLGENEFAIK